VVYFVGLILAGGEGKRWGGPKAWAELPDGRTFLESCFEILRMAGAQPVVATLPPEAGGPELNGLVSIALPEPGLDMFASLVTGLGHLVGHPDWQIVAILPVDHPLVRPATVTALANTAKPAAIPSFNGKHGHPVCLARSVVELIVEGKLTGPTLRDILRSIDAVDVDVDDPGVITNCNTPEALTTALAAAQNSKLKTQN